MERDGYESELESDDSIYRYLYSQGKHNREENEGAEDDDNEKWDDYFLDDSKLDFSIVPEKDEPENTASSYLAEKSSQDLQEDVNVSHSSIAENRLEMISRLKILHETHKYHKLKNSFLHKKCRDIFIKLKIMNHLERWGFDSEIHNDKRYIEVLREFEAVKMNKQMAEDSSEKELKMMQDSYELQCSAFEKACQDFFSRQLEIGTMHANRETKKIAHAQVTSSINKQKERMHILSQVRVKYFKLQSLLESLLRKLDNENDLGEGYTMIKYENLMMNKNRLSEKLDEKEKELEMIQDKFSSVVHMLAHMREVLDGIAGKIEKATVEAADLQTIRRAKRLELNKQRDLLKKLRH